MEVGVVMEVMLECGLMLSVSVLLIRLNVDDVISGRDEDVEIVEDGDGKSKVDSVGGGRDV
jgi:hypothetical protein